MFKASYCQPIVRSAETVVNLKIGSIYNAFTGEFILISDSFYSFDSSRKELFFVYFVRVYFTLRKSVRMSINLIYVMKQLKKTQEAGIDLQISVFC